MPDALESGRAAYLRGDGPQALAQLRPLARKGNAEARYLLGRLYYYGNAGIAEDHAESARWFARAARQGHAAARYKLGGMYFSGRGVARDDALAVRWWHCAAAQGQAESLNNLGALFALGRGVPRDLPMAHALQTLAEEHGDEQAADNLRAKSATMSEEELALASELARAMRQPDGIGTVLAERLGTPCRPPTAGPDRADPR